MSWIARVGLIATTFVVFSSTAFGQRVQFEGYGLDAELKTEAYAEERSGLSSFDVSLTIPGIDVLESDSGFDEIRVKGLAPLDQAGKPELYTTGTLIAVPDGFEAKVEVVEQKEQELENIVVRPAQRKFRCATGYRGFEFDAQQYRTDDFYPAQAYTMEEVGRLQGLRLVRLAINPMQANLSRETLKVTSRLKLHVDLVQTSRKQSVEMTPAFYQMARQVTVNGFHLGDSVRAITTPEVMLVFVADSLKSAIQPLVDWNRSKGLKVEVVTLTEAGGSKESMQTYIQNYYQKEKMSYLLFVGNKNTMPAFKESTSSGQAISDYRMALLSGGDKIPDVFYGRILADNESEVQVQVERIMGYEKNPPAGNWYPNGAVIASQEGSNPSDQDYAEMASEALKKGTYTNIDQFFQKTGNATVSNISNAIDQGRTWLAYWGHGSGTAWGNTNGGYFSNSDVDKLNNQAKRPVLIDVACLNASWDSLARPFGKAWITSANGGAAAFYGGSVSISWHPPAVMSVGIAKYHFEKPVYSIGASVLAGQLYLVEKMGTGNNTIDNIEWYNLFGDPSMYVRTNVPAAYRVNHTIREGERGVQVQVTAKTSAGSAVSGLRVSLNRASGDVLAVGTTSASGEVSLNVSGLNQLEPNTLLTTSGYNAETQQVRVR